jgi:hypothetical protein
MIRSTSVIMTLLNSSFGLFTLFRLGTIVSGNTVVKALSCLGIAPLLVGTIGIVETDCCRRVDTSFWSVGIADERRRAVTGEATLSI